MDLDDTLVSGNEATYYYGGGFYVGSGTDLTCTGTSSTSAGFINNNSSIDGGAVYLSGSGTFTSDTCDFGTSAGSDDNDPDDIYIYLGSTAYTYGDDESFTCDYSGCY